MANLIDLRNAILIVNAENLIDDEEFLLLYGLNKPKNMEIPYWQYEKFDLDQMNDDECKAEFRFLRNNIHHLRDIIGLPENIILYNGVNVDSVEALCILLKRFAYPCRLVDMVPRFARPISQISMIISHLSEFLYANWSHLLRTFDQIWLSHENLEKYARVVQEKGSPLDNCRGFVDETVRPISRPGINQRVMYNGHMRVHALKFQSVVAPNGLIANLYGPVEGKRHDAGMFADSGLLDILQEHSYDTNENPLCIYGDPDYPLRIHLQEPFKGGVITPEQQEWNKRMSEVRITVEWIFGEIVEYFKFLDFKKNLKVGLSPVGKMYLVCGLLHNARVCLYGSKTSSYFDIELPSINDYFR